MSTIKAETAGVVTAISVGPGDDVRDGDIVIYLESMKMEVGVEAEEDGRVTEVHVAVGDSVSDGDALVTLA
jgi:biotin carboxyl carrier protein